MDYVIGLLLLGFAIVTIVIGKRAINKLMLEYISDVSEYIGAGNIGEDDVVKLRSIMLENGALSYFRSPDMECVASTIMNYSIKKYEKELSS